MPADRVWVRAQAVAAASRFCRDVAATVTAAAQLEAFTLDDPAAPPLP